MKSLLLIFILSVFYSDINCSEHNTKLTCFDGNMCHENSTCCPGKGDSYMCCPEGNAVCCMDREHCCPGNTRCDLRQMRCVGVTLQSVTDDIFYPALIKQTKLASNVNSVCPDHVHYCAGAETCCVSSGTPRCCPYSYGTCCADGLHCCPAGYNCISNTCVASGPDQDIPLLDTKPSDLKVDIKLSKLASNVNSVCPDHVHYCAGAETCCVSSGTPRCCPYSYGTCCADGLHCCPAGYNCISNTCVASGPDQDIPLLDTKPNDLKVDIKLSKLASNVNSVCPDHVHSCPGAETCCASSGTPRCCPYSYGTCCADGLHCCPAGYHCIGNTCVASGPDKDISLLDTKPNDLQDVICEDGHHCNDNSTCCQLTTSNWGCCPLENAVCCPDKIHCCPSKSICGDSDAICTFPEENL